MDSSYNESLLQELSFGARTKFIRHSWPELQIGKICMSINGGLRYILLYKPRLWTGESIPAPC